MEQIKTIDELYKLTKSQLEGKQGTITVNFSNRSHVCSNKDIIGNCLQEWLPNWFIYLGVDIQSGENTQQFPDFTVTLNQHLYDVEIKAWNINASPAFDLANFYSFITTTYEDPRKISALYFILGYHTADDGFSEGFVVEKIYMKHLWEIMKRSKKYPIGLQVKKGQPYAMRPFAFHKDASKSFKTRNELLLAVKETFMQFPNTSISFTPSEWYEKVSDYFKESD